MAGGPKGRKKKPLNDAHSEAPKEGLDAFPLGPAKRAGLINPEAFQKAARKAASKTNPDPPSQKTAGKPERRAALKARLLSWLPMALVLAAAASFLLIGLSRRSPWPEMSALLDEISGPGRWSAGELSYDPDQKILTVESLELPPGGLLGLPAPLKASRLIAAFEESSPSEGLISKLTLLDLSSTLSESRSIRAQSLAFENLALPGLNKALDKPLPLLSSTKATLLGLSLTAKETDFSLASLTLGEGLSLSHRFALSAPLWELGGFSLSRTTPGGQNEASLARLSFRPGAQSGGASVVLANLLLAQTPGDPSLADGQGPANKRRRSRLMAGRLEINGLSPSEGAFMSQTAAGLIALLEAAASYSAFDWPLSLMVVRGFSASKAAAFDLSLAWEGGAVLFADKIEASIASDTLSLAAAGLSLAWPEKTSAPSPQASGDAYLFGEAGGYLSSLSDLLSQSSLNPLRSDLSLQAVFNPGESRLTVIIPQMEIASGLAYLGLLAEFSNLTPAALLSLSSLTPRSASLAAGDPALHDTGLTRLSLDYRDAGLVPLLSSAEGRALNLSGREASSRLSDALEMILAIRLDPALANLGALSKEMRAFLLDPIFLAVRAKPNPPLSPENLSILTQSGGRGLFEAGDTLDLSISVNSRPPVAVEFRPQGAFDVDYTGEDSLLHPKP